MEIYQPLYLSPTVTRPDKLIKKLEKGSKTARFFVLTLAPGNAQLEIYQAFILSQAYYRNIPRVVIGLATDYHEAVELVKQIAEEAFAKNGDCNLKDYLGSRRG